MSPDPSTELKKAKRAVRTRLRAARDGLPGAEREALGARAVEHLLGLPELASARTVMAYWSFGSEVPTGALVAALHKRGVRVVLPRIEDGDLVPRAYSPGDPTTATAFGAREPGAGAERVEPAAIDLIVTPGLAFDRQGHRVGYGGGFYDRFFRRAAPAAFRAGLAFALQLLDDELPVGRGDLRVHVVVTERNVARCQERPSRT